MRLAAALCPDPLRQLTVLPRTSYLHLTGWEGRGKRERNR